MSELKVTVRNKIATADGQKVVCGNSDYQVRFDLDAEWDAYPTKTMRVVYHDRTYSDKVFTGTVAELPVIENQSIIRLGLFAGNLHTTTPALFPCELSIRSGSGSPDAPTPSVYDQIMSLLNALGLEIGDLDELETEVKDNLVEAINEVYNHGGGGSGFDIHSLRAENAIADADELPFYDASEEAPRKTTWSNLKAKLKSYFDTLYLGATALVGYATQLWVRSQGYGTYSKPSGGIPKTDLASSVQTSLGKADSALQEHQSLAAYRTAAAQNIIDNGKASAADVSAIQAKIPSAASASNQLADKNFVNSTAVSQASHYIYKTTAGGEKVPFDSLAELEAYSGTVTPNDYANVIEVDAQGNLYYDRYTAVETADGIAWSLAFRINNTSFTSDQWAAIQSGITSGDVELIGTAVQPDDLDDYALKTDLDDYVEIAQGVANVGKVLAVGADGNLAVADITDIIADGDEVSY